MRMLQDNDALGFKFYNVSRNVCNDVDTLAKKARLVIRYQMVCCIIPTL